MQVTVDNDLPELERAVQALAETLPVEELLAVEIRSPGTALIDLNGKKAAYERFGVPSYWIVNPDPPQPELTVFELRDGRYALAAKASGPFTAGRPFAVSIAPADLTRGLRH